MLSPIFGRNVSTGPIRFIELANVWSIDGKTFETGLDAFFSSVTDVCTRAQDGPALAALVRELCNERADPEFAAWRSLEARLGYDAGEAPDGLIETLTGMEGALGEQAIEEAATAVLGQRALHALEAVVAASQASQLVANLEVAEAVDLSALPDAVNPWQLGEMAARDLRIVTGMQEGPIRGSAFADILKLRWQNVKDAPATARKLEYAARLKHEGSYVRLALQMIGAADRRFELARIVGDYIWNRENFGIASKAKTDRQKFQRAFAQSLLCPFSELRKHVELPNPTDEQIKTAARHFHVRPAVVTTLLVNKGFLARETLAERLEAA